MKKILYIITFFVQILTINLQAEEPVDHTKHDADTELFIYYQPEEIKELGLPLSFITEHDLDKRLQSTLADSLAEEPGVTTTSFSAGASRPIIRGATGDRIRILENSLGVADLSANSDDHQVMADPIQSESISVIRGPATVVFGSNASSGVVSIDNPAIAKNPIGKEFTGELNLRGGYVDSEKTGSLKMQGQEGNNNWYVSGYSRDTDDYRVPADPDPNDDSVDDRLFNSRSWSQGITLGNSYIWDSGVIGLSWSSRRSRYGVPGHHSEEHDHEHEEEGHEEEGHEHEDEHGHEEDGHEDVHMSDDGRVVINPDLDQLDFLAHFDLEADFVKNVEWKIRNSWYKHSEIEGGTPVTNFDRDNIESRVDFKQQKIGRLDGGFGVYTSKSDFTAAGAEAFVPSSKTSNLGAYVFEEIDFSPVTWQIGAGSEINEVDADYDSQDNNLYTASNALIYEFIPGYSLNYLTNYSERAANATELFADGVHFARSIYEQGNDNLEKESSVNHEIGIAKNSGKLKSQLNVYYRDYADYIALNPTGAQIDGYDVFNYSNTDAKFYGLEFTNTLNLWQKDDKTLNFEFSNDLIRSKDQNSRTIARTPPIKSRVALELDSSYWHSQLETIFVNSQYNVAEFEQATANYHMINASIGHDLMEEGLLHMYLEATNLTNEEARVHTSVTKDFTLLRGRSFLLGLRSRF